MTSSPSLRALLSGVIAWLPVDDEELDYLMDCSALMVAEKLNEMGYVTILEGLLLDRDYGDLTGRKLQDVQENFIKWRYGLDPICSISECTKNGNSILDLFEESREFLEVTEKTYDGSRILVPSHGIKTLALMVAMEGKNIQDYANTEGIIAYDTMAIPHCTIFVYESSLTGFKRADKNIIGDPTHFQEWLKNDSR